MTQFFSKNFYKTIFLFSIFFSIYVYSSSLGYYFFQDDFFELNISKASNFIDYLNFFTFRDDIIAYRPISLQNYFFFSNLLSGFNPIVFRTVTFTLFLISAYLIAALIKQITGSTKSGLLSASLWLTSSIHFMSITWIAAAYNIIGTFFWLLTSFLFISYLKKRRFALYLLTYIIFAVTIGSYEFSVTWPAIFFFYYFFVLKNSLIKSIKLFLPFIFLTAVYLILRTQLITVPEISEYQISFNLDSIKSLVWYALWSLNVPEEFKKQVSNNVIFLRDAFLVDYWQLALKSYSTAFLIVIVGIVWPIFKMVKNHTKLETKIITFFFFWFACAITPVLILPNHTFSMYLTLASIGLYSLMGYLITKMHSKVFSIIFLTIWLSTSFVTLDFYKNNSWMVEAQKTAKLFNNNLKTNFPHLPKNSIVLYPLNNHWEKQALLGNEAIRAIYNDPTLSIYYNKEEIIENLDNIGQNPVFIYEHE